MSVPESIDLSTGEIVDVMSEPEARELTEQIRNSAHDLRRLITEAHDRKAWSALGYASFEEWIDAELRISKSHAYRLMEHEATIKALQAASPIGDDVDVRLFPNEAQSRVLSGKFKDDPGLLATAWTTAVQRAEGHPTQRVVREVAEEMRPSPAVEPKAPRVITVNQENTDIDQADDGWEYAEPNVSEGTPDVSEAGSVTGLAEAEMLERLAMKIDAEWASFGESARISVRRSTHRLANRLNKNGTSNAGTKKTVTPIAKGKKGR